MKQSTFSAQVAKNLLNVLQGYTKGIRFVAVLTVLLTMGIGQVWGADYSKNESWAFTTSGNSNWSGHNSGYCGACGNKSSSFNVYKTNITNFSNIDFSKYENVSLTIYVKAGTNSGTNSYTVKLINASGNQVSTYTSTKTNGMGNGSSSSSAKESSVTFNPTMAFSGYKIEFPAKAYITQTRYVLTYDDKTVSYTINWTINPTEGGDLSSTSGSSITVTPDAAYTYASPAYTVTSGTATVSQSGNTFTATPTANSTIQINMVEKPKYTVTLVPGSGSVTDTELTETSAGAGVELPTPTLTGCDEWTFAGWKTTSAVATETTTQPTLIPAGAYSPTSDITLYAVYQRTEETEGTPTTTNKTYTHTITAKTWSANGAQTLNSVSWTLDNNGNYYGYDGTKGQQVGSGNNPAKSMTLTTSGFSSATKITAVRISTSGASSISGSVGVTVGSTAFKSGTATTKSLSSTNTEYEFTGSSSGNVTISWSQTSSKAIYFKAIEVDYQTTTGGGNTTTTYYISVPDCATETLVSVLPKIVNFWQSIFGVSLGYLRDKTGYRHVLGGIVVVSLHHRCTKIDFHHINMSRTAFSDCAFSCGKQPSVFLCEQRSSQ